MHAVVVRIRMLTFLVRTQGANLVTPATFENWGQAVFVLLRVLTGEAWESVMYDLYNAPNNLQGAPAYFFSFQVFTAMLLLQMVVGIMLNSFQVRKAAHALFYATADGCARTQDMFLVPEGSLSASSMETFAQAWSKRDPYNTGYVPLHLLPSLLREVKPPLGPGKLARNNLLRYVSRLQLLISKDGNGDDAIYYPDLLRTLSQIASPSNLDNPNAMYRLERSWRKRFPKLQEIDDVSIARARGDDGHLRTTLQDTKRFTMKEYVAAVKIQRAYRQWLSGGSMRRRGLGGDPDTRLFDDVMSWKKLSSAAASARQSALNVERTSSKMSLLRRSATSANSSESSTPVMSRQGSNAGAPRSPRLSRPERPSSPSPDVAPSPKLGLSSKSKRRVALEAADAAAREQGRDSVLNDNNVRDAE